LHGGIAPLPFAQNLDYPYRRRRNHDAKRRIARCVADFVPDHSSLLFGIGTTLEQCAFAPFPSRTRSVQSILRRQHAERMIAEQSLSALAHGILSCCCATIYCARSG